MIHDGDQVLLEFDGAGVLAKRYLWGPAVDQLLAEEILSPLPPGEGQGEGLVLWLLADHQGTIRDVAVYASGQTTVENHLTYDAFGNFTQSDAGYEPSATFAGREWDEAAGLYYYRLRWYDAVTSRFLAEDPLGFAAGDYNLTRYVGNSPLGYIDPFGLEQSGGSGGEAHEPAQSPCRPTPRSENPTALNMATDPARRNAAPSRGSNP